MSALVRFLPFIFCFFFFVCATFVQQHHLVYGYQLKPYQKSFVMQQTMNANLYAVQDADTEEHNLAAMRGMYRRRRLIRLKHHHHRRRFRVTQYVHL